MFFIGSVILALLCAVFIVSCSAAIIVRTWTESSTDAESTVVGLLPTTTFPPEIDGATIPSVEQIVDDNSTSTVRTTGEDDETTGVETTTAKMSDSEEQVSRIPKTVAYTIVITVCLTVIILLGHLCVFHAYINVRGMTTYEYLKRPSKPSEETPAGEEITSNGFEERPTPNNNGSSTADDPIWTTMTEIDLNAPDGGTLDKNNKLTGPGGFVNRAFVDSGEISEEDGTKNGGGMRKSIGNIFNFLNNKTQVTKVRPSSNLDEGLTSNQHNGSL